ncbi:MAG TPA: tryptophan synthase subunit alpha, partial [Bacteroidetes bacterium]|nr:tryptophan synthase subunit alpha [Bacteroidota bacterium]
NDTRRTLLALNAAGADIIEIGMPFSDPLADGSTIQASSQKALENGMNLKLMFEQLKGIRQETDIPVVLMGYINPVMVFGVEAFCEKCQEVGIDGLILPDLPLWEFENIYKPVFEKYGLHNIFLVTPQTSDERVRLLDAASGGFLYAVSVSTTTGSSGRFDDAQENYFKRLSELNLNNPILVGFGIAGAENFNIANKYLNGGVVGSAFIRALEKDGDVEGFVKMIRG